MARTKAADYEQQREAILELAARAFAQSGFPSSSMASLAAACGTSKARLYHYYEGKEAILFDLLERYTRRLVEITEQVRSRGIAPREELRAAIQAFLAEYENSRERHAALLHDVKFLAEPQRRIIIAQQRRVVAHFAALLARAFPLQVDADNAKPLAMMLFGMINWTFTWLKSGGRWSYADFADCVIAVLLNGIPGLPETAGKPGERNARALAP